MKARWAVVAASAAMIAGACAGCSKPVLRVADASLGDYYSNKEFSKLSHEQRDEYCNDLAMQDSLYLDDIREAEASLAEQTARRAALEAETDSLLAEAERREQNIRTLQAGNGSGVPSPAPGGENRPGTMSADTHDRWNVRRGDSLWRISSREDVYGDGAQWRRIFESNRGAVRDPDRIYPGQELSIPR